MSLTKCPTLVGTRIVPLHIFHLVRRCARGDGPRIAEHGEAGLASYGPGLDNFTRAQPGPQWPRTYNLRADSAVRLFFSDCPIEMLCLVVTSVVRDQQSRHG